MALMDPVKIYAASSSAEAQIIRRLLDQAGIEAFAAEDFSPAGVWMGGTLPGVYDAGIWINRADTNRATAVIREHERLEAERLNAPGAEVEVVCEDCGKMTAFPATYRGTVQECTHCGAYLDVGEPDEEEPSDEQSDEADSV
jgi:hypothetical protein